MFFGGILLSIGTLMYGYFQEKNKNQGARVVHPSSRIIARFAIDKMGSSLRRIILRVSGQVALLRPGRQVQPRVHWSTNAPNPCSINAARG